MQRDYILRLIEQLTQVVTVLMNLRRTGQTVEAQQVLDEALQGLFGLTLAAVEALSAEALIDLVRLSRPG